MFNNSKDPDDPIVPTFTAFNKSIPNDSSIFVRHINSHRGDRLRLSSSVQKVCSTLLDDVFVVIIDIDNDGTSLCPRVCRNERHRIDIIDINIYSSVPVQSAWKQFLMAFVCILCPRPKIAVEVHRI